MELKRIIRDRTVPPEKRYRAREPVAEVELGESIIVETVNSREPIIGRRPAKRRGLAAGDGRRRQ